MAEQQPELESAIRADCDVGDYDEAATVAVRGYGPEILGFLASRLRNEAEASEVFSQFCEDFWLGLPRFEWRCTARVWAYTLARHAANRHISAAHRRPARNIPLSRVGLISGLADQVRSTTLPYLRTEVKSRMRVLREQLSQEDQTVLILRVDKGLSWRELAEVTRYAGQPVSEALITKEAARLRKRFQLAKDRLRKLAEAEGLVGKAEDS